MWDQGHSDKEIVNSLLRAITRTVFTKCVWNHREPSPFKINEISSVAFRRNQYNWLLPPPFIKNPGLTGNCYIVRRPCYKFEAKTNTIIKTSCHRNKYDEDLIQRLFFQSFETGLTSGTIATEIKPLLRTPSVPDEPHIFVVSQVSPLWSITYCQLNKSKKGQG